MQLQSTAFEPNHFIPQQYTGEGDDQSPPLHWSSAPATTKSFALIVDDPDAPSPVHPAQEPWVHWLLFNIPASICRLPEAIPKQRSLSSLGNAEQGRNSWTTDSLGYRGPMPPPGSGKHRYRFHLYALDTMLESPATPTTKHQLLQAMRGHVLVEAQLVGCYERP